jgi:hypothetical protein
MDLERYDVPPLQPGERRRLDPADEALLQVRFCCWGLCFMLVAAGGAVCCTADMIMVLRRFDGIGAMA